MNILVSKVCRRAVPAHMSNNTSASCLRIYRPAQYMIHFEFRKGFDAYKLSLTPAVFLVTCVISLRVVPHQVFCSPGLSDVSVPTNQML
jgi:hypothetical protein